jgi:hypothetical protein
MNQAPAFSENSSLQSIGNSASSPSNNLTDISLPESIGRQHRTEISGA